MFIRNSFFAFLYRIFSLLFIISGILRHLSFSDISHNRHMFSFFTIQSNLFCMILFIFLCFDSYREMSLKSIYPYRFNNVLLRGICLSSITVTFLIFQFVLKRSYFSMCSGVNGTVSTNDLFVHYLTPLFTVSDWILFEPKGQISFRHPLYWLILPVCYFTATMIRGYIIAGPYPYFFMDISTVGAGRFIFYSAILISFYTIIAYIIALADKILLHISIR